ncbi:MAG TPA: response regulator transcription factor [Solirubrobacteraceae bacterium]|nr:response regulator transcription factor [Solirubrobacteraceae bacterium]
MKRVVVVADHAFAVERVRSALRQAPDLRLVRALDGRWPVAQRLAGTDVDVAVVDEMRRLEDALARVRELAAHPAAPRVLLLACATDDALVDSAFEAGADAVISKAVHPVALGTLLRETVAGTVVHRARRAKCAAAGSSPLTAREAEILGLAAQGFTNGRIARQLWITEQTVKFHLSNCYRKLGVANRTEASRYAFANALVTFPESVAS